MILEPQQIINYRTARNYIRTHHLIRMEAKNRSTGNSEAFGVWDGDYDNSFNVGGFGPMNYIGAGAILELPQFTYEIGLDAKTYEIGLSHTHPDMNEIIRGYDPRFSKVNIWRTYWNNAGIQIANHALLIFEGFIDGTPMEFAAVNDTEGGGITLRIVSSAKFLTHYGTHMKNADFQKRRSNDQFRKYSSVELASVPWGQKQKKETDKTINKRPQI